MARLLRVHLELWKPELLWFVLISGQFLMVDIWHPLGSLLYNLLNHFRKLAILVVPFFSSLKSTLINIFVLHSAFKEFINLWESIQWDEIVLICDIRILLGIGNTKENKTEPLSLSSPFEFIILPTSHLYSQTDWMGARFTLLTKSEMLVVTLASLLLVSTANKSPIIFLFISHISQHISLNLHCDDHLASPFHKKMALTVS